MILYFLSFSERIQVQLYIRELVWSCLNKNEYLVIVPKVIPVVVGALGLLCRTKTNYVSHSQYYFYTVVAVWTYVRHGTRSIYIYIYIYIYESTLTWRAYMYIYVCVWACVCVCVWCNGYRRRKWTRRPEFKSWTRLITFHSTNTLGKGMNPIILPPAMVKW